MPPSAWHPAQLDVTIGATSACQVGVSETVSAPESGSAAAVVLSLLQARRDNQSIASDHSVSLRAMLPGESLMTRILLIDDDPALLDVLSMALEDAGLTW